MLRRALYWVKSVFLFLQRKRHKLDLRMKSRYSPHLMALLVCGCVFILAAIMLFVPPFLGTSNDGSFDMLLQDVGLQRLDQESQDVYYNYYERQYLIEPSPYPAMQSNPVVRVFTNAAIFLDTLITRDGIFDLRVLALLYLLLYLVALYPMARFLLSRVNHFSEGIFIALLTVLIFSDASVIVRFASFYVEPILLIAFLGVIGGLLMQTEQKPMPWMLIVMSGCMLLMILTNAYCAIGGIVVTAVCIRAMTLRKDGLWRGLCVFFAMLMSVMSIVGFFQLSEQNSPRRQYHALTRGPLLQSEDPEETLASFGIAARYSVLADTYSDQNYPVVIAESGVLDVGFLDQYTISDILLYYIRHPGDMISMIDIGVKAAFVTRPSYSGNYERSAGLPEQAKTPFMSIWSTFKSQSAPRTIGFLAILIVAILVVYYRRSKPFPSAEERRQSFLFEALVALVVFSLFELATVILCSGDAELVRESYVMGVSLDLFTILFISEVLHRTNIIKVDN